jgi:hypothetical protein
MTQRGHIYLWLAAHWNKISFRVRRRSGTSARTEPSWNPIEQRRAFWIRRTQNGEIENTSDDDHRGSCDRGMLDVIEREPAIKTCPRMRCQLPKTLPLCTRQLSPLVLIEYMSISAPVTMLFTRE